VKVAPFDAGVQMGPLISKTQRERVAGFIERARAAGVKILTGGGVPKEFPQGYYYEPTVVAGASQDAEIIQSEVFGPVLTVNTFQDEAEALRWATMLWPLFGLTGMGRAISVGPTGSARSDQRSPAADVRNTPRRLQAVRLWQGPIRRGGGRLSDYQTRDDCSGLASFENKVIPNP
jgi:hypothetical protein